MTAGRRRSGARAAGNAEAAGQCYLFEDCLPDRLQTLGLRDVERVLTHTNHSVMLSLNRRILRIHRGYAFAPDDVLKAIIRFLNPRVPRGARRDAERAFLDFPVQAHAPRERRAETRERAHPGDLRLLHRLEVLHGELNGRHFEGRLEQVRLRLSGRMRTRLGELSVDLRTGRPLELSLSRRHITRHPWTEVEHTLLHEMVHQWQAEMGLRVDHGPTFRRKAREVGILPAAKRTIN